MGVRTMKKESVLMTVEELAERWGVNTRTIRSEIQAGRIKAIRIGRLVKVSRSHVEFLENGGAVKHAV
jgi:excisionase family DNA binding protein